MFKISAGAARTLIEGWYISEAEFTPCEASVFTKQWMEGATPGEVFSLGFVDIVRREDGDYIRGVDLFVSTLL